MHYYSSPVGSCESQKVGMGVQNKGITAPAEGRRGDRPPGEEYLWIGQYNCILHALKQVSLLPPFILITDLDFPEPCHPLSTLLSFTLL